MESRMVPNLTQQLIDEFHGDTLGTIAGAIGETPAKTGTALRAAVPAVLAVIARKVSHPNGSEELLDIIHTQKLDTTHFATAASALAAPDGVNALIGTGQRLGNTLLGSRLGAVTDWLASQSGMSRASARSLLSIAMPIILSLVGRRAGGSAAGLTGLLKGQDFLKDAPPGLESALGMGAAKEAVRERYEDVARARAVYETEARRSSWWKWAVPLAAAAGLLWLMTTRDHRREVVDVAVRPVPVVPEPTRPTAPVTPSTPTPTTPSTPAPATGAMIEKKLPDGSTIRVPAQGVETMLIGFIEDPNKKVDQTTWFSFDRLEFEQGSARLSPASQEQLRNVAAILKTHPKVAVKLGGYTDNVGDAAQNKKLSTDRANTTMNELIKLGVERSRLSAEGYGQEHPVADNSSEAGRQRNRRIDVLVVRK